MSLLFRLRGPQVAPDNVAFIYFDRNTSFDLGLSTDPSLTGDLVPLPRSVHACVLKHIISAGAAVVVYDVVFSKLVTPKNDPVFTCRTRAGSLTSLPELKEIMSSFGKVALLRGEDRESSGNGAEWQMAYRTILPSAEFVKGEEPVVSAPFVLPRTGKRVDGFWTELCQAAATPGGPGCAAESRARTLPVVALEFYRSGKPSRESGNPDRHGLSFDREAGKTAPEPADRLLNFYGPPGTIPCRSYQSILIPGFQEENCADLSLEGKAVFIGAAEFGRGQPLDEHPTVFSSRNGVHLSGVEILATAFSNLESGNSLVSLSIGGRLLMVMLLGLLFGAMIGTRRPVQGVGVALVVGVLYLLIAYTSFTQLQRVLPVIVPLTMQIPLTLMLAALLHFRHEHSRRMALGHVVSAYLPERAVTNLQRDNAPLSAVETVEGVCMATDLEGYTTAGEKLQTEDIAALRNAYYGSITSVVRRYGGEPVDQHYDSTTSIWDGARHQGKAGQFACHAALDAMNQVAVHNRQFPSTVLGIRFGLHAGEFRVGGSGGSGHLSYGAFGEVPIIAGRLEQLNKHLGTRILATRAVLEGNTSLLLRSCGMLVLMGKSSPLEVIEVVGRLGEVDQRTVSFCAVFASAMQLFNEENWAEAFGAFRDLSHCCPGDGPTRFYLSLARTHAENPASGSAVTWMDSK